MKRFVGRAILISVLIHLLIFLLLVKWGQVWVFPDQEKLLALAAMNPDKQIRFEIVETGETEDSRPENARFLSDKNTRAKNQFDAISGFKQNPYQKGDIQDADPVSSAMMAMHETDKSKMQQQEDDFKQFDETTYGYAKKIPPSKAFSKEQLLGLPQRINHSQKSPRRNQQDGSVEEFGSFSLNTYAWEYGPYLLEVKRRIQRNMYPPPSFTHLGIGGVNVIRFRILQDGTLVTPEVLAVQGDQVLVETSGNALQVSAPFPALPKNFPEDYLEVTAKFQYIITHP